MASRRAQGLVRWILTSVIAVVAIGSLAYGALRYMRPTVTVTEAVNGPVVQAFYATGTILPFREYPLKSNVAGILTELRVDKGDVVKKGQILAVISDPELIFRGRQAQAELKEKQQLADDATSPTLAEYDAKLKAAQEMLEIAQRDETRLKDLVARSAASQTDVDRASDRVKTQWSAAESIKAQRAAKKLQLIREQEVAQAALDIANWNLEQQQIKSPTDGVVLDRPTSVGTRLAINDHIMQVADVRPSNLVMRAQVDEEDVINVKLSQAVKMTLYSFPGEIFEGKVDRVYDKADPDRRTFEVDIRLLKEESRLAAGMTGELAFVTAAKDKAVVIPSQALQNGAVWTIKDGRLRRTSPEIGIKSVERIELIRGLDAGEKVVISPIAGLDEGSFVRSDWMDPTTAAGLNKPKNTSTFKGFN